MTPFSTAIPEGVKSDAPSWLDANVVRLLTRDVPGGPEWSKHHQGTIGGRAAVNILLGNNPAHRTTGTPFTEYQRLTGKYTPPDLREDEGLRAILDWGSASEDLHRTMLERETRVRVEGAIGVVQSIGQPYLVGTIDGSIQKDSADFETPKSLFGDGERGVLELKAPHFSTWHEWEERAPTHARLQAAYYATILGLPFAVVSGLIPPLVRWEAFDVPASMRQQILDGLGLFWTNHVMADTPPLAIGGKHDLALLKALHPLDDGSIVQLPEEFEALYSRWDVLALEIKAMEDQLASIKSRFAQAIGNATWGQRPSWAVSYKHVEKRASEVSASTYRKFHFGDKPRIGGK